MGFYQEQRRNRDGLSVEDGGHHLAAAPFYLFLVVGKALAAREHIVHDDDSFSPDVSCDAVVPFKDALAALALVQALSFTVHIDILQPGGEFLPVGRDVPVEPLEPPAVLYPVAARHEHDMTGSGVHRQGGQASLEEVDAVILSLLEGIEGAAEHALFLAEQSFVPRRIIMAVERHADAPETERLERMPVLVKVGMGEAEHPAGVPVPGQHSQTAVTVTLLGFVGEQGGGKSGFPGFLPPVTGQPGQAYCYADQYQKHQSRFHCSSGDNGYFRFSLF